MIGRMKTPWLPGVDHSWTLPDEDVTVAFHRDRGWGINRTFVVLVSQSRRESDYLSESGFFSRTISNQMFSIQVPFLAPSINGTTVTVFDSAGRVFSKEL